MNNRLNTFRWLLLTTALVVLSFFAGCRAFQPEAVVVNRAPETFLIGAPLAEGGGYYHYHMFWYGLDEDGVVEKFVWTVTDTSVQVDETAEDEEDARFNPALDITHLDYSYWTTNTDSIFDFQINQGTAPSADMTFHIVAVDDFGDFDRTPARLHFFSNTLGSPVIDFFQVSGNDTIALAAGEPDTVGFRKPYHLYWRGSTPNVLGYDLDALAAVDTVYPFDDGLYGYKWQLTGDLGNNCQPAFTDCWHPRLFNEATGDSFSYYAEINSLLFLNDASSSTNPFGMELPSGQVNVRINSVDVAGVEVGEHLRNFQFVVNHDPETILLQGRDWAHAEGADPDTFTYPYYTLLNDPTGAHHPFQAGARIPDRSYVVFKALAKDNSDDAVVDPDFKIGMTGIAYGERTDYTGSPFSFSSGASDLDFEPEWDAGLEGWYADTLGFLVGPKTEFSFVMQAVDEHGRRDGTPPSFNFHVGFPPCVQCIELKPNKLEGSDFTMDMDCHDPEVPGHECFVDEHVYYIPKDYLVQQPGRTYLTASTTDDVTMGVRKTTMVPEYSLEPFDSELYYIFDCKTFFMTVFLHGMDDPREAWPDALNRARGWKYQVDYSCDPGNDIKDGGGFDDLLSPTWGFESGTPDISISEVDGLWRLNVRFIVPEQMLQFGMHTFRIVTHANTGGNDEITDKLMDICLRQFSPGTVKALVLDQTKCGFSPSRPARYHMFETVRPPGPLFGDETWRDCSFTRYTTSSSLSLSDGTMDSAKYSAEGDLIPSMQEFNLIYDDGTDVQCGWVYTP